MNASASPAFMPPVLASSLVILLLVFAGLVSAGVKIPLVGNPRMALVILIAAGMFLCTQGIGRVAAVNAWAHPLSILGYLAGASILALAVLIWLGRPLPFLGSQQAMFLAITGLIAIKWLLTQIHPLIR